MAENKYKQAMNVIEKAADFAVHPHMVNLTLEEISLRIDTLEPKWKVFNDLHDQLLETAEGEKLQELFDNMEKVQSNYFKAAALFKARVNTLQPAVQAIPNVQEERELRVKVDMPFNQQDVKNTWGQFDGTVTKWQGFHDRFVAAIHENENVSQAYKFQYLKQSLVGQAKKDFGEWLVSDEGYKECWDRLKQMYDIKYLIRREYLRNFLRLPELHGAPTQRELQHMANVTHETLRQLKAQGLPVEYWNFFIVHCLHERLDPETGRQWELQRETDDPGALEMLDFIERQAAALPTESAGHRPRIEISTDNVKDNRSVQAHKREGSTHRQRNKYDQKKSSNKSSHCKVPCDVCTDMHQIWECDQFLSLSFRGRRDFVDRRNICPNCLKKGHKEDSCYQRGCVRCPGAPKHNILLCPAKEVNKTAMNFRVQDEDDYSLTRKNKDKGEKKKKD